MQTRSVCSTGISRARAITIGLATIAAAIGCLSIIPAQSAESTAIDPEMLIVPGKALGTIKLGYTPPEVHQNFAACDGKYALSDGFKAESYEWKEPTETMYVRVFYDPKEKVVQVSSQGIKPETADHLTMKSTMADIENRYKSLKMTQYKGEHGLVDYYDEEAKGICFKFSDADKGGASNKKLLALIVHAPGKAVIPEPDETIAP